MFSFVIVSFVGVFGTLGGGVTGALGGVFFGHWDKVF